MNVWPGTMGTMGTSIPGGAASTEDEGWKRIRNIMNGKTLPRWREPPYPRFVPDWTKENMKLCREVIKNTQEELKISSVDHEDWKAKNPDSRKNVPKEQWERQRQGWLGRKAIWV